MRRVKFVTRFPQIKTQTANFIKIKNSRILFMFVYQCFGAYFHPQIHF